MKKVLLHGALALLGLGLAWRASRPTEAGSEETHEQVFECAPARVASLTWSAGLERVEIIRAQGDAGYQITHTTTPADGEPTTKHFRGLGAVTELFTSLAPLTATRDLGEVDEGQLSELGLDADAATLTLVCGERTDAFALGASAYGSGSRYLRRADGGHVYLVPEQPFRDLGQAEGRLMQRELHAFEMTEVDTIEVHAFEHERTLLQHNRQNPRAAQWVDAAQPERTNELFGNWLRDVGRLRAQRYLPAGVEPPGDPAAESEPGAAVALLSLRYLGADGTELGHVDVQRLSGSPERFFARSEASMEWVEVAASIGANVARDVASVVGAAGASETPPASEVPGAEAAVPDSDTEAEGDTSP